MTGSSSNHMNLAQQYVTCDVATDKLDLAAEHIKTQNGESADIAKVNFDIHNLVGKTDEKNHLDVSKF
jgi:hypothetical protein